MEKHQSEQCNVFKHPVLSTTDNWCHSTPVLNGCMQTYLCWCSQGGQWSWERLAETILASRKVLWEMLKHAGRALGNLLLQGILIINEMSVLAKWILLTMSVESADTCLPIDCVPEMQDAVWILMVSLLPGVMYSWAKSCLHSFV